MNLRWSLRVLRLEHISLAPGLAERLSSALTVRTTGPPATWFSISTSIIASSPSPSPSPSPSQRIFHHPSMAQSQTPTVTASNSSSNYQAIFDNALEAYKRRTKKDLRLHPLFTKLEACNSPDAILATLREQIPGLDKSPDRWSKWLDPTVTVLYNLSAVIGAGIGLVSLIVFKVYSFTM